MFNTLQRYDKANLMSITRAQRGLCVSIDLLSTSDIPVPIWTPGLDESSALLLFYCRAWFPWTVNYANQFRERNILPAVVFLRGFGLKNHWLCTVDVSAAHSPLNPEPLLQEASKAFHKSRVGSLRRPGLWTGFICDCKTGGIRGGSRGGGQGEPDSIREVVNWPKSKCEIWSHISCKPAWNSISPNTLYWSLTIILSAGI